MPTLRPFLLVEDDRDIREALAMALREEGYTVFAATDGEKALTMLRSMPRPCIILVDWLLPGMNGHDLIDALRDDDRLATIPIAVMSGLPERAIGRRDGYTFIKKPIDFERLLWLIESLTHDSL